MSDDSFVITPLPSPVTGQADWRDYRCFSLENGVTVCLVHDATSPTTAAAAVVHAGAAADPKPGLAHFCEHMVFLGSHNYPGENEYKQFLAQHGGRSNASTSMHLTTFKFDVLAQHAEQALDIFAQFFVAPLFTESGTSREVHAVDSENSKNLVADVRRRLQVLKDLADADHYYAKFSTGNSQTLPTTTDQQLNDLREALLAFHAKHYRPDQLTVVVAGPQSLDEFQRWVVPRFAPMQARHFSPTTKAEQMVEQGAAEAPAFTFQKVDQDAPPLFHSPFYSLLQQQQQQQPLLVTTKPVRSMRRLVLQFPLPSVHTAGDQSPVAVLSHLLGHEGPHSAFAVLQNAQLLSSLSAGARSAGPDFTPLSNQCRSHGTG